MTISRRIILCVVVMKVTIINSRHIESLPDAMVSYYLVMLSGVRMMILELSINLPRSFLNFNIPPATALVRLNINSVL